MNLSVVKVRTMKMSYRLKIDPKSRKSANFISKLQRKIQAELIASGMTQQEVADVLGVDRSVVNRRLKGSANLTARSIAEFAYAFGKEIDFEFVEAESVATKSSNYTVSAGPITRLQESIRSEESTSSTSYGQIEVGAL